MLRVIDIRTPPAEEYPLSSIPADARARLASVMWDSHGGDIEPCWHLEVREILVEFCPPGQAGSMGYGPSQRPDAFRSVRTGVCFSISAIRESVREESCLLGWLAWHNAAATRSWNDFTDTLRRNASKLGSLCPFEEPERPSVLPWLLTLRMPPWRTLSNEEQADLHSLRAPIGWGAIQMLS